jgi:hypothetical protein
VHALELKIRTKKNDIFYLFLVSSLTLP